MQVSPSTEAGPRTSQEEAAQIAGAKQIFERVFVHVDYSLSSHRAVGAALELRQAFGSRVCLFQFAELDGSDEFLAGIGSPAVAGDLIEETKDRLHRFVENIFPSHLGDVELRACRSVAHVDDLHREARRWGATLVIATADSHAKLFRSDAEKLIHGFDLPVLVIPLPADEA